LVRKAFDILLPALPSRLPANEFIKAIKWTKKIAYEEGHVLGQLVHIWFLIVRHPALFYPFRSQFVPLMVNSLNRLAIPPSSTPDNRRLAVNIVDLVIAWEQTRQERIAKKDAGLLLSPRSDLKRSPTAMSPSRQVTADENGDQAAKKRKIVVGDDGTTVAQPTSPSPAASSSTTASAEAGSLTIQSTTSEPPATPTTPQHSPGGTRLGISEDEFELSGAMVDLVVNFAFRFALASADKQETSRLAKTCGELFDKALQLWPSASIRFSYFDKLIAVTAEAIIRQQQQAATAQLASGQAGSGSHQTPTVMPPFFVVPKGAPLSSLAILDAVLGILNSLIKPEVVEKSSRQMPYVIQYAPRIMKLLEPCFDRSNPEVQTGLTTFLRRMTEVRCRLLAQPLL